MSDFQYCFPERVFHPLLGVREWLTGVSMLLSWRSLPCNKCNCMILTPVLLCMVQVASPEFKAYARQVKANSWALAAALMEKGYKLMSNGASHQTPGFLAHFFHMA